MLSLAFLCIAAPLAQVHPLVWRYVVDDVLLAGNAAGLWVALGVMLASQLAATLFAALQSYFIEKAGQGFVRDVRNAVFSHLEEQSMSYHHERHTGDLVARVISDVDAMETSVLGKLERPAGRVGHICRRGRGGHLAATDNRSLCDDPVGALLPCRAAIQRPREASLRGGQSSFGRYRNFRARPLGRHPTGAKLRAN